MNDAQVLTYLLSHAPLDRFYLIEPPGASAALMMYFDSTGKPWSIMEDDDAAVGRAVDFLKRAGAPVFDDYAAATKHEKDMASRIAQAPVSGS
jgi:hypothetical protein